MYFTLSNIAGGDARRFRTHKDGRPSDAAIRYARRLNRIVFAGYTCDEPKVHDKIEQAITDRELYRV